VTIKDPTLQWKTGKSKGIFKSKDLKYKRS